MAAHTRRRESTLNGFAIKSASTVNLFDMSLGEDVTLEENAFDTACDPDLTIKHATPHNRNTVAQPSLDLLGDATPLPAKASHNSFDSLPLQPSTSIQKSTTNNLSPEHSTSEEESHIARLLIAIERLRGERDELRTQLDYVESEKAVEQQTLNDIISEREQELVSLRRQEEGPSLATLSRCRKYEDRMSRALEALSIVVKRQESVYAYRSTPIADTSRDEVSASLRDQIKTLEAELKAAQDNLQEIQQDYDGHLWTCSKEDATTFSESVSPLVEELEGRVARRTERIGILQHDVKRLECNLGLAEEQITELNTEIEGLTADNKCLAEDSATARRERDAAREMVISLETQVESLRSENSACLAEARYSRAEWESAASHTESLASRCEELESALQAKEKEFKARLEEKDAEIAQTSRICAAAQVKAASFAEQLDHIIQHNVARDEELETARRDLRISQESLEVLKQQSNEETTDRMEELEKLRKEDNTVSLRITVLEEDCRRLSEDLSSQTLLLEKAKEEATQALEQKYIAEESLVTCQASLQERTALSETLQLALNRSQAESQSHAGAVESALVLMTEQVFLIISKGRDVEKSLRRSREQFHAAEKARVSLLQDVQSRDAELRRLRTDVKVARDSVKKQGVLIQTLLWEADNTGHELGTFIEEVALREATISELQLDLNMQQERIIALMDSQSKEASTRIQEAEAKADQLQGLVEERQRIVESLEQQRISLDAQISTQQNQIADLEDALRVAEVKGEEDLLALQKLLKNSELNILELEKSSERLQNELAEARSARSDLHAANALNAKLEEEVSQLKQDLTEATDRATSDAQQLQQTIGELEIQIAEKDARRDQENQVQAAELATQMETLEATQIQLGDLRRHRDEIQAALETQEGELHQIQQTLQSLRHEHDALQTEARRKEVVLESTLSQLRASAEELKKSLAEVDSLQAQAHKLRKELSNASQQSNAARLEFDLQVSRHNQEIANLKKALGKFQNQPNLREKVEELEARNEELEETLQARCTEIEENDDRFLEVLKEKKKLAAKIESLNRKVFKLQKQLAESPDEASPPTAISIAPTAQTPPLAQPPRDPSPQFVFNRENIPPNALASTNSAARTDHTPTKEKRRQPSDRSQDKPRPIMRLPELQDSPLEAPISRKRPAPDDFNPVLPKAPQPIVATSPAQGLRKAFNGIKSGFTPTRNSLSQSPLKKKSAPSLGISDITNSPRARSTTTSTTASRGRSWLGKIRGDGEREPRPLSQLFNPTPLERQAPFP